MPILQSSGSCRPALVSGVLWLAALMLPYWGQAQPKYLTSAGHLSFFSATPVEDIEARNDKVVATIDFSTGQVTLVVPIREFQFKRTLMQAQFNEKYMESAKFPRATFTGQIVNAAQVLKQLAGGTQNVEAEGNLTIHGVTRKVIVSGTLGLHDGRVSLLTYFNIAPTDYSITIPKLMREHIAKSVSVRFNATCESVAATLTQQP